MTVREKMVAFEKDHSLTKAVMARVSGCSAKLIDMVENGDVTHPEIAKRIGAHYFLTEEETEELMPINYRKHGGDYEPDRYVVRLKRDPFPIPAWVPASGEVFDT